MNKELMIVVLNDKTGKEVENHIKNVPRIGEGIISKKKYLYRVTDIVWDSDWYNSHSLYHEVRIYVKKEFKK